MACYKGKLNSYFNHALTMTCSDVSTNTPNSALIDIYHICTLMWLIMAGPLIISKSLYSSSMLLIRIQTLLELANDFLLSLGLYDN